METISIDISHHPVYPDVATLRIKGFVYANTLSQLEKTLELVISNHKKNLIFDLSETHYVSSGGWSIFLMNVQKLRNEGGDILLAGMKPEVYDAFELLEFHKFMKLFSTADAALKDGYRKIGKPSPAAPAKTGKPAS